MTDSGLLTGLTHLVEGRTRSISPENFHGEKGKGGMATEGTGKNCARELGQGRWCARTAPFQNWQK